MAKRIDSRLRAFADRVNEIARTDDRVIGGRKILISHVWDALDYPHRREFDRDMLAANKAGLIELQRADMPQFFDEEEIDVSRIEHPVTGALYHLVMAPARKNPPPPQIDEAREMFMRFHRLDPKEVTVEDDQQMPTHAAKMGKALHVLYRSGKVDPETGKKPRTPVNYIHEHDAGVHLYDPNNDVPDTEIEDVPECEPNTALVLLGQCLGLAWHDEVVDEDYELAWDDPDVELYTTTSGKMLVVVEDKREILYLVWGGALGVEPRGIVG